MLRLVLSLMIENDDIDDLAQPFVDDHRTGQERIQCERIDRVRQEARQDIGSDSDLAA